MNIFWHVPQQIKGQALVFYGCYRKIPKNPVNALNDDKLNKTKYFLWLDETRPVIITSVTVAKRT